MNRPVLLTFSFFLIFLLNSQVQAISTEPATGAAGFRDILPGEEPAFPAAFYYAAQYKVQWWYFTGHLYDKGGREFGYELTFFVFGIQKRKYRSRFGADNIYAAHFAITDPEQKRFLFTDTADRGAFGLSGASENKLKVWVEKNSLQGTPKKMRIRASAKPMAIDFILIPEKPVVLNGEHGYSRKSASSPKLASIYFSYTRLKTEGSLTIGRSTVPVTGASWFDREISSQGLAENLQGWDWFSIQLDDGREIMLYLLRNKDGTLDPFSSGTFVFKNGRYRHLEKGDFRVKVLDRYRSEKTGARYPAKWEIEVPSENIDLIATPLLQDQEFIATSSTGNHYWEGSCFIKGTATGRAYVELTGY